MTCGGRPDEEFFQAEEADPGGQILGPMPRELVLEGDHFLWWHAKSKDDPVPKLDVKDNQTGAVKFKIDGPKYAPAFFSAFSGDHAVTSDAVTAVYDADDGDKVVAMLRSDGRIYSKSDLEPFSMYRMGGDRQKIKYHVLAAKPREGATGEAAQPIAVDGYGDTPMYPWARLELEWVMGGVGVEVFLASGSGGGAASRTVYKVEQQFNFSSWGVEIVRPAEGSPGAARMSKRDPKLGPPGDVIKAADGVDTALAFLVCLAARKLSNEAPQRSRR